MPRKTVTKKSAKVQSKATVRNVKRVSPKAKSVAPVENKVITSNIDQSAVGTRSVKVHKMTLIVVLIIIILGVLLYFGRGLFVAAVVNGQPISRLDLVQQSEKASGKQVMTNLIRNVLIEQVAAKQNVKVTDKEISDQIKTIEDNLSQQGQKLDQMLALEGMTRGDLTTIIKQNLLVTKLVGKDIKVSDKEISDFITKNQDQLPKDKTGDQLKAFVRDQIVKSELPAKAQTWLADLEKKAKIIKFVNY